MSFDPDDPNLASEFRDLSLYLIGACAFVAAVLLIGFSYMGTLP